MTENGDAPIVTVRDRFRIHTDHGVRFNHAVFTDDRIFYNSVFLDGSAGHNNTILDRSTFFNGDTGGDDREVHGAVYHAALCDHGVFHVCIFTDVLRRHVVVAGIYFPVRIVQVQRYVGAEQIHIGFPQAVQCADIFPVTLEFIGKQAFVICQHCRNNILTEVLGTGVGVFIFDQILP